MLYWWSQSQLTTPIGGNTTRLPYESGGVVISDSFGVSVGFQDGVSLHDLLFQGAFFLLRILRGAYIAD